MAAMGFKVTWSPLWTRASWLGWTRMAPGLWGGMQRLWSVVAGGADGAVLPWLYSMVRSGMACVAGRMGA